MAEKMYGLREIATYLDVGYTRVSQWHHRGRLPVPGQVVSGTPLWEAEVIEPWMNAWLLLHPKKAP
jgi:hypothetical protein